MRHGKTFVDEQGAAVAGRAGLYAAHDAAPEPGAQAGARYPSAAPEAVKRAATRPTITVEEMTDRIYRRYAVN